MSLQGLVVAAYGKRYQVELPNRSRLSCVTRGKKTDLACGDIVQLTQTASNEGVVEKFLPRKTLLYRSSAYKSKMLAANVTQAIIVLATQPSFYEGLLNRCLVAAEVAGIRPLIVLNKCDLNDESDAQNRLHIYEQLGYAVLKLAATQDVTPLQPYLRHQSSVLVGQSGMGKSTIVNALVPEAEARTQTISEVLDSGKHTTTAAHLYHLDDQSTLIDSPGLQEFGVHHLNQIQLELAFPEFKPFLGHCRFNNCRHLHEPDCAVLAAAGSGQIAAPRLQTYQQLTNEIGS